MRGEACLGCQRPRPAIGDRQERLSRTADHDAHPTSAPQHRAADFPAVKRLCRRERASSEFDRCHLAARQPVHDRMVMGSPDRFATCRRDRYRPGGRIQRQRPTACFVDTNPIDGFAQFTIEVGAFDRRRTARRNSASFISRNRRRRIARARSKLRLSRAALGSRHLPPVGGEPADAARPRRSRIPRHAGTSPR